MEQNVDKDNKSPHIDSNVMSQPSSTKEESNIKKNGMANVKVDLDIKTKESSTNKNDMVNVKVDNDNKSLNVDSSIMPQPPDIKKNGMTKVKVDSKAKVDSDIKTKVSSFLKDFYNQNPGSEIRNEIVDWFEVEMQMERDRWLEKIQVALREIESQRRFSLSLKSTIETASQQLVSLLHRFDLSPEVIEEIARKDSTRSLERYVQILSEIFGHVFTEHAQCLEILGVEGMGGASLVSLLQETIDELVAAADSPGVREENEELKAELSQVKNVLDRKQTDVLSLQRQLNDINDLINDQFKVGSEVAGSDWHQRKIKGDNHQIKGDNHQFKGDNQQFNVSSDSDHQQHKIKGEKGQHRKKNRSKQLDNKTTRSDSGLFEVVPSSGYYKVIVDQKNMNTSKYLDTNSVKSSTHSGSAVHDIIPSVTKIEGREEKSERLSNSIIPSVTKIEGRGERPERVSSERSQALSSVYSQPTNRSLDVQDGGRTERSLDVEDGRRTYVEISEEKLRTLKIQAKKLETSLKDAISTMDRFNKKMGKEKKVPVTPSSYPKGNNSHKRLEKLKVPSWQKIPFEVQGSRKDTNTSTDDKRPIDSERLDEQEQSQEGETLSTRATRRHGPVSKCLRCQTLFRKIDNHKMACCYHSKAKERFERYNNSGQLLCVMYLWKCCKQEIDSKGCCFGQHI